MKRVDAEIAAAAVQREGLQATIVESQYKPGTWLVVVRDDAGSRDVYYSRESVQACLEAVRKQRVCAEAPFGPLSG